MHHLDVELIEAALAGDLPVKTLVRRLLAHVAELCPECEATVTLLCRAVEGSAPEAVPAVPPRYIGDGAGGVVAADPRLVGAFDRRQHEAKRWAAKVGRERKKAREDVRALLALPQDRRRLKIERAQTRYRTRAVADLLFEESRRLIRERPEEARELAELVEVVLRWMPGAVDQDWARELGVRAQAWIANTYRVQFDFRAAERVFEAVRARCARELVSEAVHAEVASLEASLRFDEGRCEEARVLLERAEALARAAGESERVMKVLVQRALVEDRQGDSLAAAELQARALMLLKGDVASPSGREWIANLALFLVNGGEAGEAAEVLARYEGDLAAAGMWRAPQLLLIRGRVALAHGREQEAEELFLAARADFIRNADAVRAAIASLDLAVVYLGQGKSTELRRMARLMGSIFESAELESEALAAVVLFQRAVEQETVSAAAIRSWRRQLEVGRPAAGSRAAPS